MEASESNNPTGRWPHVHLSEDRGKRSFDHPVSLEFWSLQNVIPIEASERNRPLRVKASQPTVGLTSTCP